MVLSHNEHNQNHQHTIMSSGNSTQHSNTIKNETIAAEQHTQPQYHYITSTNPNTVQQNSNNDGHSTTTATIIYENYEEMVTDGTGNDGHSTNRAGSTIIKFEGGEYEIIKTENILGSHETKSQHLQIEAQQQTHQQQHHDEEVLIKYEEQDFDDGNYEEFQALTSPSNAPTMVRSQQTKATPNKTQLQQQEQQHQQQFQQSNVTYKTITLHNNEINQTITETIAVPMPPLGPVKQKRKRKTRSISGDEQGEYLEKMSVRGLDIQRYEHIIDGVSYCLVCAKSNIFKTFKNKYSFQRHAYLFHEGVNRKIFACPICNKEFSRPDKMKMHKKDKHGTLITNTGPTNVLISNSGGDQNSVVKNVNEIGENSAAPPPAKKGRAVSTKTPRPRKPRNSAVSSKNTVTVKASATIGEREDLATQKRLAQIDSVLDEVQNADSNQSIPQIGTTIQLQTTGGTLLPTNNNQQQQQQQQLGTATPSPPHQHQPLPSIDFNGMILPGGAHLAIANTQPHATTNLIQNAQTANVIAATQSAQPPTAVVAANAGTTPGTTTTTLIYSNQIDLQQALLQQQLHGQSIMIQDQAGNLLPLPPIQTITSNGTLEAAPTIYATPGPATRQQIQIQAQPLQTTNGVASLQQPQHTLVTAHHHPTHIKVETLSGSGTVNPSSRQNTTQHYELENVTYLTSTAATPSMPNVGTGTEPHVIGTVQSYQILTPDGLHSYHAKLEPNELAELCPTYSMSTATPQYTFSNHLTTASDPSLHSQQQHQHHNQQHHQPQPVAQSVNHQNVQHPTLSGHNHHQQQQQQQHHPHQHHHQLSTLAAASSHPQQQQHQHQQTHPHPQFMELKNDLLIKSTDSYSLDAATSMYHLPFSPTSMINAVSDVNSSALLESKEIRLSGSCNNDNSNSNGIQHTVNANNNSNQSIISSSNNPTNIRIVRALTAKDLSTDAGSLNGRSNVIISNINKKSAITTRPIQILLTRKVNTPIMTTGIYKAARLIKKILPSKICPTAATTTIISNNNNSDNNTNMNSMETLAFPSLSSLLPSTLISTNETVIIEDDDDNDDDNNNNGNVNDNDNENYDGQQEEDMQENDENIEAAVDALPPSAAEILKRYPIPKGTALTAKFTEESINNSNASNSLCLSTTLMSPPLTNNGDLDNSSNLVEYVEEEILEEAEELGDHNGSSTILHIKNNNNQYEQVEVIDDEEEAESVTQIEIEDEHKLSNYVEEYQESHNNTNNNNELIEEVDDQQFLLNTSEMTTEEDGEDDREDSIIETKMLSSNIILTNSTMANSTSSPQIIQTVQPDGTITCFQLPPNAILLSSPNGASILASTATPPPFATTTKCTENQINTLQSWHEAAKILNGSNCNIAAATTLPAPTSTAPQQPASPSVAGVTSQPTTVIVTADGTAIPFISSLSSSSSSSVSASAIAGNNSHTPVGTQLAVNTSNVSQPSSTTTSIIAAANEAVMMKAQLLAS